MKSTYTDDIYTGDVYITTQEEIDNFPDDIDIIDGDLIIGSILRDEFSDITDLTPLNNLTHIKGDLIIQKNPLLIKLTGLYNLKSIGGDLRIEYNEKFYDYSTLNEFEKGVKYEVKGDINIID